MAAEAPVPVPWVDTIDLRRVPWIGEDYAREKANIFESIAALGLPIEEHRRRKYALGLTPGLSLSGQQYLGPDGRVESARDFFEPMPLEIFMEGPRGKQWKPWCEMRGLQLDNQRYWDRWDEQAGLHDGGGAG